MKERDSEPILDVVFYKTDAGSEPVREWLKSLPREDRRTIGEDIKTAIWLDIRNAFDSQDGAWPLGSTF